MLNVGVTPSTRVGMCFAKLKYRLIDTEIKIFNEHNHKPLIVNILIRQKISSNLK